ncbi:XdhC family protein [Haliangium ochraceum]|uniref:XdhC/CoxI family protein n=1 Tax=Haliangium ochraceum (strain DSM 14365 / JCM 11303 / SMP-2) TaxID=502025 RepID=D0LQ18_HALO1|nr:XdhC/CoxI family protein [Haliangium ochraceum]ACY17055.1 protein of unknown function DUF182 [Haliangium ochraceum DSM 14365]
MSSPPERDGPPSQGPGDIDDVLQTADAWRRAGRGVALATVVRTWGSSPRPAGSQLAVRDDGAFVGSVSGGCVEGAVVEEGRAAIASGAPRALSFGVSNERAWEVGLACGGKIRVHVAPLPAAGARDDDVLARVLRARADKRSAVWVSALASGQEWLLFPRESRGGEREDGAGSGPDIEPGAGIADEGGEAALLEDARAALAADSSRLVERDGEELFLRVYSPPLRLIVVGAVHIAQALCPMAALAGFSTTVVDPRSAFATAERFPGVELSHQWPDRALAELTLDHRCAVVTLTHDPKLDEPALAAALGSDAFYIGALGSTRTQAARLKRMRGQGVDDTALERIHGPVGLAIGARSAAEIAVSILAQIVDTLRRRAS